MALPLLCAQPGEWVLETAWSPVTCHLSHFQSSCGPGVPGILWFCQDWGETESHGSDTVLPLQSWLKGENTSVDGLSVSGKPFDSPSTSRVKINSNFK